MIVYLKTARDAGLIFVCNKPAEVMGEMHAFADANFAQIRSASRGGIEMFAEGSNAVGSREDRVSSRPQRKSQNSWAQQTRTYER